MPSVNVDVDKINNTMVPLANTALSQLNTAISSASRVNFPSGEFGWSGMVGSMRDCYNQIRSYSSWIQNISASMANAITAGTESLESITVDSVNKRN